MKNLLFTLPYHTQWGEQVEVVCSLDGEAAQRIVMQTPNGEIWQASLQVPDDARHIRHAYLISDAATGTILRAEPDKWDKAKVYEVTKAIKHATDTMYKSYNK